MENGDLGNGGGTQSRWSTRSNYRNTASSSDSDIIRICTCGREVVVCTSWTSTNPGRQFRGCPSVEGKYCGSFQWVDPPMCRRSKEVIPGLLAQMNQYESAVKRAKDRVELESNCRRRDMEQTFVDSLLKHARHGQFRADRENRHVVHCSLRSVNIAHGCKIIAAWAFSRVKKLQERHAVFNWLIHRPDVVWNRNLKFVTVVDGVWEEICREKKTARYYINAYEDLFEDLCVLFGEAVVNEQALEVQPSGPAASTADPVRQPDGVLIEVGPAINNAENPIVIPPMVVNIISDNSDSSGEFWRVIEEYCVADSDPDSMLPLPGVPSFPANPTDSHPKSPSRQSQGPASNNASNTTPLKDR